MKGLLRDVLDLAFEQTPNKRQRERRYKDDVYFTPDQPPDDLPEWAFDENKNLYETDAGTEGTNEMDQLDEFDDIDIDDGGLENFATDFILNSAEMNLLRPEDLDEVGESSTAAAQVKSNNLIKFIYMF